jgi:hypothetical protein
MVPRQKIVEFEFRLSHAGLWELVISGSCCGWVRVVRLVRLVRSCSLHRRGLGSQGCEDADVSSYCMSRQTLQLRASIIIATSTPMAYQDLSCSQGRIDVNGQAAGGLPVLVPVRTLARGCLNCTLVTKDGELMVWRDRIRQASTR